MNEHLFTNNDGLRLITQFEGAPRLKARRCEGGAWELSYGVTFYPDGSPVREGDTCTEEEAMAMFRHALQVFEEAVKRLVTVPLTSHQFSALVAFCYNIGESNMASSTVLKEVNAGRFDDAAAAFGMWVFATLDGYKQAFRGLLRRRYAEAACFLGYDWTEACADEAIALQREKPASLPGKDRVIYKTPFKDVLRVAQRYPLSPATQPAPEAKPAPAAIPDSAIAIPNTPAALPQADAKGGGASLATQPVSAPPAPAQNSAAPAGPSVAADKVAAPKPAPVEAPPPAVPPVVAGEGGTKPPHRETKMPDGVPYGVDLKAGAKPMEATERFVGSAMMWVANGLRVGAANGMKFTGFAGFVVALFLDMMKSPVTAALILSTIVAAILFVVWLFGVILEKTGLKKKKAAEVKASQLMY